MEGKGESRGVGGGENKEGVGRSDDGLTHKVYVKTGVVRVRPIATYPLRCPSTLPARYVSEGKVRGRRF